MLHPRLLLIAILVVGLAACMSTQPTAGSEANATGLALVKQEAQSLRPFVQSPLAHQFLEATADLPAVSPRKIYRDAAKKTYHSKTTFERLPEAQRAGFTAVDVTESLYYTTKYGSPLAYARPMDLLGQNGLRDVAGKRILDFGYGGVGHLRLLALLGANVVGVDVDPLLTALYGEPQDQGKIRSPRGQEGTLTLHLGQFPADDAVRRAVGGDYDLIISKNTLKNGYIHPAKPVDKRLLVNLGVDDAAFVRALHAALKPGGLAMIYNLCPAPSPEGQPYKPWADGRCPFSKELWEKNGFSVLTFDVDDSASARRMGLLLGWDQGKGTTELEKDLFALYTLVQKQPNNPGSP